MKKNYFYIFLLLFTTNASAQKITGTWEGILDDYEFLQINIVQVGNKICGYTWDYELNNKNSYCKAYFSGNYHKIVDTWFLEGYSFIENNGGHSLMQLKFNIALEDGKLVMKGLCRIKPLLFFGNGNPMEFRLEKTSSQPTQITAAMKACIADITPAKKEKKAKENITKEQQIIAIPAPKLNDKKNNLPALMGQDTLVKEKIPLNNNLTKQTNGRINKELSHIIINDRKITLYIYDNGTIDGDTVSVYYNGKAIVKKKLLTANPIIVDVELDEKIALHSIVLFAENLGSIPPNTALVIFTSSTGKRYELHASATMQQNAEMIFEYKPK